MNLGLFPLTGEMPRGFAKMQQPLSPLSNDNGMVLLTGTEAAPHAQLLAQVALMKSWDAILPKPPAVHKPGVVVGQAKTVGGPNRVHRPPVAYPFHILYL